MTTETPTRTALGCDYSTHFVHLAKIGHDGLMLPVRVVNLDDKTLAQKVAAIGEALAELAPGGAFCALAIEDGFVHLRESEALKDGSPSLPNYKSPLQLAGVRWMVITLSVLLGLEIYILPAASWRSLSGVFTLSQGRDRKALKSAALKLVKLEYGYETRDDNEAEAICLARAGLGLLAEASLRPVRRAK